MSQNKIDKTTKPTIVLASSSHARRKILDDLRLIYTVYPSDFKEKIDQSRQRSFEDNVRDLAIGKARNVASKLKTSALVIGADSFAVLDGKIMGKPLTKKRAIAYLQRLSGRWHDFYTGVAIIDVVNHKAIIDYAHAKVYFRNLFLTEIAQYIEKEDVLHPAGAYKIQGLGATLIEKIDGDYYAVIGLSSSKLAEMFKKLGFNLFDYVKNTKSLY